MSNPKRRRWLEVCKYSKRIPHKHLWEMGKCTSCGVYETPRLVSERACFHVQECDGCEAYRDHQR